MSEFFPASSEVERPSTETEHGSTELVIQGQSSKAQRASVFISPDDRLSTLPAEILALIFQCVGVANIIDKLPMTAPLSRSLLPYTQSNVYCTASFNSLAKLELFTRTILPEASAGEDAQRRGAYLASLVHYLAVQLDPGVEFETGWDTYNALKLFKILERLAILDLAYCPQLVIALTSIECSSTSLKKLLSLSLTILTGQDDVFEVRRFSNLGRYPNVSILNFWTTIREQDEVPAILPPLSTTTFENSASVTELELRIDSAITTSQSLATFLAFFPNLESLTWHEFSNTFNLETVLKSVSTKLTYLEVEQRGASQPADFGPVLARFPQLEFLRLNILSARSSAVIGAQSCPNLSKIHLARESWAPYRAPHVPYSALKELLHLRCRPRQLCEIEIDFDLASEGDDLYQLFCPPPSPEQVGWTLPAWQDDFSYNDALSLLWACTIFSIRLSEALRVQEAWDEGIAVLERRVAEEEMALERVKNLCQELGQPMK